MLFFAIFWLVPFVVAVVAGAVAGDCSFTPECTDTQSVALLVAVIVVLFWALVAAPLTLILGLVWILSRVTVRKRGPGEPMADVRFEPMPEVASSARDEQSELVTTTVGRSDLDASTPRLAAPKSGVTEQDLRILAGVLWVFVLVGSVIATGDDWGLAVASFAAIVTIPLTVMLAASWVARRLGRSTPTSHRD